MKYKKVLLMPSPSTAGSIGSVLKSIGIARILKEKGAEICFSVGGDLADLVQSKGFQVIKSPTPTPKKKLQDINNMEDVIEWTGMGDPDYLEASVKAEIDAIREFKPDVIFAETRPCSSISVRATGVPSVVIASWPQHPDFPFNQISSKRTLPAFNQVLKKYHLPETDNPAELIFMFADLKIAPTLPELEPELQILTDVHYSGYCLDGFIENTQLPPWFNEWLKKPLIFIYLSVGALPPRIYMDIIRQTFADSPYQVLCSCGFHYEVNDLPASAGNIRFIKYIPIQEVIGKTALIIFHGGQDTMLTALLHGLPGITITGQHFERKYNASQLERLGASINLPIHAFRPTRLKKTIDDVFNGQYQNVSINYSGVLRSQYKGTAQCADIILSACR